MKFDIPEDWCTDMAELEEQLDIAAGEVAFDPVIPESDEPFLLKEPKW